MGDVNGVANASDNGFDSSGKNTITPRTGYNGQVVVAPKAVHYEIGSNGQEVRKSRASIVFHELAENFERTENGINYNGSNGAPGAHQLAITRENGFVRKSNMPGQVTRIVNPKPGKRRRRKNVQKMTTY